MSTPPAAVCIDALVMQYGDKRAVDNLSLTIEPQTITAVLGPNGAGKTTTLETCEGYRKPQQGAVRVLGLDPWSQRQELLPRIGVMLQGGGAWSGAHAMEILRHFAALHAYPLPVEMLAERLNLAECGRTAYRRLSGGQQQRLALATALVGRPELVFVDEPTAGMDPQGRRTTWGLLEELRRDGVTVVLTTHHMDEAERLADHVHIIDHGHLIASGTPAALTRGQNASVRLVVADSLFSDAAGDLQAALAARGQAVDVSAPDDRTLVVSGHVGHADIAAVAEWCQLRGVEAESLNLGHRTLEDVFLEITGRELGTP